MKVITVNSSHLLLNITIMTTGWMYGEYEGNHGSFPSEYVQPIVGLRATKDAIEVQN